MKKFLSVICGVLLVGILAITFTSCSKEEEVNTKKIKELRFNVKVNNNTNSNNTKVVKTIWANGDKIYVYFPGVSADASEYATLTYDGSSWSGSIDYDSYLDPDNLSSSGSMMGIYFPFGNVIPDYSATYILAGRDDVNPVFDDVPVFSYYLVDEGSDYTLTVEGDIATLTGTLNMTLPNGFVYFYIDAVGGKYNQDRKYRLAIEGVKPISITNFDGSNFETVELGSGLPMWGYKYGDGIAFAGVIDGTWATEGDHKFIFFSDGDPAVSKTFTNVKLASHGSIKLKAPIAANGWDQAFATPTYTAMKGGTKWADWNLCCAGLDSNPYTYDFRWSEIVPNGAGTLYSFAYSNSLIDEYAVYDPAKAFLGSNWRMPTLTEFTSLKNNSDISVHAGGDVTGGHFSQLGIVFTNKDDDTKSIVFTVADESAITFWTSSNDSFMRAYYVQITNAGFFSTASVARDYRRAIRPIYIGE